MVENSWAIQHIFLACVKLHQKDSCQRLVCPSIDLNLKSASDILISARDPKHLLFPILYLTSLEVILLRKQLFHSFPNWSTQKVSFEAGEFIRYSLTLLISRLPDFFIFCANSFSLLFGHSLLNLYSK